MDKEELIRCLKKYRMAAPVFGIKKDCYESAYMDYRNSLKAVAYRAAAGGGGHRDSVVSACLACEEAELGLLDALCQSVNDTYESMRHIDMARETELGCTILWMLYIGEMTPMEIRRSLHISKDTYYREYDGALEMILEKVNSQERAGDEHVD